MPPARWKPSPGSTCASRCGTAATGAPRSTSSARRHAPRRTNLHDVTDIDEAVRPEPKPLPALSLGHGAPPLLEDRQWMTGLGEWAAGLPRPTPILIVSAHWQTASIALSSTRRVPLVYDFYGFPEHYSRLTYAAPGAPEL